MIEKIVYLPDEMKLLGNPVGSQGSPLLMMICRNSAEELSIKAASAIFF